jgi:hypothetical protein
MPEAAPASKATLEMCEQERQSAIEAAVRECRMGYDNVARQVGGGKSAELLAVEEECATALRATLAMCDSEKARAVDAAVRNVRFSYEKKTREAELCHTKQVLDLQEQFDAMKRQREDLQAEIDAKEEAFNIALHSKEGALLKKGRAINVKEEQRAEALASTQGQLEADYLRKSSEYPEELSQTKTECTEALRMVVVAKEEATLATISSHTQGMAAELHAWEERTEMTVQHVLTKAYETVQQVQRGSA